jgi:hypothetical protein
MSPADPAELQPELLTGLNAVQVPPEQECPPAQSASELQVVLQATRSQA